MSDYASIGAIHATVAHLEIPYVLKLPRVGVRYVDVLNDSNVSQEHDASEARLAIDGAIERVLAKHDANEPLVPNPNRKVSDEPECSV